MTLTTVNPALLDTQAQYTGMKSRIINGGMTIDQRNAGASVTLSGPAATYLVDRWNVYASVASKLSFQQNAGSVTPPAGFTNYLGITSLSAYSVGATDEFLLRQPIEGYNVSDLGFGAAGASTVTLSFWVRSSLTGSFGAAIQNASGLRSYPFSYTISVANTWEQKTVTVAGDTTGTWLKTNGIGLQVSFGLGVGSTYGSGTAGAWAGAIADVPTGSVSVVGTSGATFYITGVQLEKGSTATSFDYRPYGTELDLCLRYYEKQNYDTNASYDFVGLAVSNSTSSALLAISWKVLKRAIPTVTTSAVGSFRLNVTGGADGTVTQLSTSTINVLGVQLTVVRSAAQTVGNAAYVNREGVVSPCFISASAEL